MFGLLTMTSGALAIGYGIYRYLGQTVNVLQTEAIPVDTAAVRSKATSNILRQDAQKPKEQPSPSANIDLVPRQEEQRAILQRGFHSSAVSLGITSGGLLFPALQFLSVPVLIYMGVPSAQDAYTKLCKYGCPSRELAETAVLAICLGGGWYFIGSLGFCLYYTIRIDHHRRNAAAYTAFSLMPQTARRINETGEITVSPETLHFGDKIFVQTSDMVPVNSIIEEGVAWVQPAGSSNAGHYCLKQVGDQLTVKDVIVAGRLSLRVIKKD